MLPRKLCCTLVTLSTSSPQCKKISLSLSTMELILEAGGLHETTRRRRASLPCGHIQVSSCDNVVCRRALSVSLFSSFFSHVFTLSTGGFSCHLAVTDLPLVAPSRHLRISCDTSPALSQSSLAHPKSRKTRLAAEPRTSPSCLSRDLRPSMDLNEKDEAPTSLRNGE